MRALLVTSALSVLVGCAASSARVGFIEAGERGQAELVVSDTRVNLAGSLAEELAMLTGAYVKVWGAAFAGVVTVDRYQILDAGNGFFAYVGWFRIDQMGCALVEVDTGRRWGLLDIDPTEFRAMHGAKIWVTAIEVGTTDLRPLAWGILRPADP